MPDQKITAACIADSKSAGSCTQPADFNDCIMALGIADRARPK